jgi:ribosomal protein S27AE
MDPANKSIPAPSAAELPVTTDPGPPPNLLTREQAEKLIAALNARGVLSVCPRCGNSQFNLVGAITLVPLQSPSVAFSVANVPRVIPSAVAICSRCGFVATHALGSLGFSIGPSGEVVGL